MVVLCVFEVACIRKHLAAWISKFTINLLQYMAMYLNTNKMIFWWCHLGAFGSIWSVSKQKQMVNKLSNRTLFACLAALVGSCTRRILLYKPGPLTCSYLLVLLDFFLRFFLLAWLIIFLFLFVLILFNCFCFS
jgi:hypothetical protein